MRWQLSGIAAFAAGTLAVSIMGLPSAFAIRAGVAQVRSSAPTAGPVSAIPANGTPFLVKTSTTMTIRQLVQCGPTMYAVGEFSQIGQNGTTFTRNNIFSFGATSPFTMTSWIPDVNGEVNSIALNSNCTDAYIGGQFTKVGSTTVADIAEIDTTTGAVVPSFGHDANGVVDTLAMTSTGHLLAGGKFTSVNGGTDKYMASLNPVTGADDGFLTLNISGRYHYCNSTGQCSVTFPTQIYNQQISHNGNLDLAEGVFTSAGGQPRQQIFMLNLAANPATVTGWTSPEWDGSAGNLPNGYPYQCWFTEPFYIRAAAWSPDDSTVYIATTGFHPYNLGTSVPRSGLCDAAAAFPASQSSVLHTWINYTGCDSLYSAAADDGAVYVAGHPRWSENSDGCNHPGSGAIPDPGLQGLAPSDGSTLLNGGGTALYTMSRANADDMLITSAGLWIASTNRFGSNFCVKATNHAGICLLPYPVTVTTEGKP
jgi:hypothetical protein